MRLSGIEIVVGEPSEKVPTRRRLHYIVSFKNDAGEECQQRHETLVHEQALHDAPGIARIVAHVVRGLMIEDADADALLLEPVTRAAAPRARAPSSSADESIRPSGKLWAKGEALVLTEEHRNLDQPVESGGQSCFLVGSKMEFVDRVLKCVDCGEDFIFSVGEQVFFREKQFQHQPKHCKKCKAKHKNAHWRIETNVTCSECGTTTTVPFMPHMGRPVLCRSCFQTRRGDAPPRPGEVKPGGSLPHTGDTSRNGAPRTLRRNQFT
jgi:CxxC-x17-CxxC domain-containing protein